MVGLNFESKSVGALNETMNPGSLNSIAATYPGFQALPKGVKQLLLVSESVFFEDARPGHHPAGGHHDVPLSALHLTSAGGQYEAAQPTAHITH